MVLAELYKVNIGIRSISVHNKQLISIVFNTQCYGPYISSSITTRKRYKQVSGGSVERAGTS